MQPTAQQYEAIHNHEANLIVEAGAGSGKTRVLVERFLQLLGRNPDWPLNALVAITFTRAAALEMRQRLRTELEARAEAGPHWARHLAQMDSARINTIHSLCADILRANAADAGIDPQFEVLDETEAAILLADVVDDVRGAIEPPLSNLFAHYDAFQIVNELNRFELVNHVGGPPADAGALLRRWHEEWSAGLLEARDQLLASQTAIDLIDDRPPEVTDSLANLFVQYFGYLKRVESEADAESIVRLLAECYRQGAVGNKGTARYWGGIAQKKAAANSLRDLRGQIKALLDDIGAWQADIERATANILPLWQGLIEEVQAAYRRRKEADDRLDFDDLERLAAQALDNPDVQARYRKAEFKHLLVDEFQDTNAAQWRIISALADVDRGGSLFVVGDPKQSIYQFRGADVSVFNRVRDEIARHDQGRALPLSTSFRSHAQLIEQFNALFKSLFDEERDSPAYDYEVAFGEAMRAFRRESPDDPAIEIQLLDKDLLGNAEEMRRWEAFQLAGRIKELVAEGRQVFDKDERAWRGIKYGDIAMLFQSMANVTLYEDGFKAGGIPFLTVAGRGYYDRQEVWDMLNLLRFLHNPADDLSLATVLRSPMFAFSDDLLFALRLPADADDDAPGPLWEALRRAAAEALPGMIDADRPLARQAVDVLSDLRRIAGRVTIAELLRGALTKTDYLAILTGLPDGARRRGNVEKLLQLAQDSGKVTLGKFSVYLADLSAREAREGEAPLEAGNAVQLMTVHASKGLEFPFVILPDASWTRRGGGASPLLIDPEHGLSCRVYDADSNKYVNGFAHQRNLNSNKRREAAERKRLLYVAATRACDYLLISGGVSQNKGGQWTSSGWLGQILDALDIGGIERITEQTFQFADAPVSIRIPAAPPPKSDLYGSARPPADCWDFEAGAAEYPPAAPPLMASLPPYAGAAPGHISATQIGYLGGHLRGSSEVQRHAAARRFRDTALRGLATPLVDISFDRPQFASRLIGEIVHELLRLGNFALEGGTSEAMIRAIAWGQGLTDPADLRFLSQQVRGLLAQYASSKVCRWIESAREDGRPLHTELPFIYRRAERVIHGAMDVLLQGTNGEWRIIDYKTSEVSGETLAQHAQRYRLQLGVYAAAAQEHLGLPHCPQPYVHYIRHHATLPLSGADCLAELERLEAAIGDLAGYDH